MSQPGNSSGTSGPSWGSQASQTPSLFPPTGNTGSAIGWGSTGPGDGWPQNNLAGQNQQLSPSQQPLQGLFPPSPGTGLLSRSQAGLNNPNQSALNNSFASFQANSNQPLLNNPNQSALNNPSAPSQANSNQSLLNNPNQSALNNLSASFQANSNQSNLNQSSLTNSFFNDVMQQNSSGTSPVKTSALNEPQRNWQAYQANKLRTSNEDEYKYKAPKKRLKFFVVININIAAVVLLIGGVVLYLWHHNSVNNPTTLPQVVTPSITPLFSDSFQNNNNGWDTSTQPPGSSVTLAGDGKLVLEDDNNKLLEELVPGGKTFNDLRVDVDANLTKGDQTNGYGLCIRGALNSDGVLATYYCFEAYGNGNFAVYKGVQNTDGTLSRNALQSETANHAILFAGQTNHLTVIAQGIQMSFQINNTTVYSFNDNSYKGGSVALFVSNFPTAKPGAQATFERLAIFPVS